MGALPKKKVTQRRRNNRRSHHHLRLPQLSACPQCRRPKPTHQVCPFCGTYNGHAVLDVKETARPL
ncbi:MAG: 50S ribosomal protein L32 [Chloroflexi bacterium]|nr:50S ribosomal protein L32 [Chloroflexota bacterium]